MIINKVKIITVILTLSLCIACGEKTGENSKMKESGIMDLTDVPDTSSYYLQDTKFDDNETAEESDIPQRDIDKEKNNLISFWETNRKDLETMAEEMKKRGISHIDNYTQMVYSDTMSRVLEQAKEYKGTFDWRNNAKFEIFRSDCDYWIYKTRVFKDENYGFNYSLWLVYSEYTVQDVAQGYMTEELAPGWILIIRELPM